MDLRFQLPVWAEVRAGRPVDRTSLTEPEDRRPLKQQADSHGWASVQPFVGNRNVHINDVWGV